jgi:hypothetical protein
VDVTFALHVVAEPDPQSWNHDDAHTVDAVVDAGIAPAQNSLAVPKQTAEKPAIVRRIPSHGDAW